MKKLWVDDKRSVPSPEWDHVTTFHHAIVALQENMYDELSLDHDLGCFYGNREMTGGDIINWLESAQAEYGQYVPPVIHCHSANPDGAKDIRVVIERLKR